MLKDPNVMPQLNYLATVNNFWSGIFKRAKVMYSYDEKSCVVTFVSQNRDAPLSDSEKWGLKLALNNLVISDVKFE